LKVIGSGRKKKKISTKGEGWTAIKKEERYNPFAK